MDNLLILLHYLANNHASNCYRKEEGNPYSVAYRALDSYLTIMREVDAYGEKVRAHGGFEFAEAKLLTECLITGFETGLLNHHDGSLATATYFVQKYMILDEIDKLIEACQQEKQRMEREKHEQ